MSDHTAVRMVLARSRDTDLTGGLVRRVITRRRRLILAPAILITGMLLAFGSGHAGSTSGLQATFDNSMVLGRRIQDPLFRFGASAAPISAEAAALKKVAPAGTSSRAELRDSSLWVTDGEVTTLLVDGDRLFIGGKFSVVGPPSGGGGLLDPHTGFIRRPALRLEYAHGNYGSVFAAISDGFGGWFLGGAFSRIQGQERSNLAHIGPDGIVTDWNPGTNGEIRTLVLADQRLYVGGDFTMVGGQTRRRIAAIDPGTGSVEDWNPSANELVTSIALGSFVVFAGGAFDSIGGGHRARLAALDPQTGIATDWNPSVTLHQPPWVPEVEALLTAGPTLYVGGAFDSIGGVSRNNIAAFDLVTGDVSSWDPNAGRSDTPAPPAVFTLAFGGDVIYAGGYFDSIGARTRNHVAAIDINTARATDWNPDSGPYDARHWYDYVPGVYSLAVLDSTVFIGGGFISMGGAPRSGLAAVDRTSGAVRLWNPHTVGPRTGPLVSTPVFALATDTSGVFAGGDFMTVGGRERRNISVLDRNTGEPTEFAPQLNGTVTTMLLDGSKLYFAGGFTRVGNAVRNCAAAIDVDSGALTPWDPNVSGAVQTLAREGSRVFIGGGFMQVGLQARARLAVVDTSSGHLTPWDCHVDGPVWSILPMGSTIYIGGWFVNVGGVERRGIAAVDAATGSVLPWNARLVNNRSEYSPFVYAMALMGNTLFFGGEFSQVGGQSRWHVAAVDTVTGASVPRPVQWGGVVYALALIEQTPCVAGAFGVAAIDSSGRSTAWEPDVRGAVWSFASVDRKLYVGGNFLAVGEAFRPYLAALSTDHLREPAPIEPMPIQGILRLAAPAPSPTRSEALIRFGLATPGLATITILDMQGRNIRTVFRREEMTAGWHEVKVSTRGWRPGVYFCRLEVGGASASKKLVVTR
jgi:hypothetical protein